jgi:hypothetical protein
MDFTTFAIDFLTTLLGRAPTSADLSAMISPNSISGGGTITLQQETYSPTGSLSLQSNVILQGQSRDGSIIDFGSNAYSLKLYGSNIYNTGTVSVTNGTTTVTGSGTAWNSSMVGKKIFLNDTYYTVASVSSLTSLDTDSDYSGANLSGAVYSIADVIENFRIQNITVQNSSGVGIDISNALQFFVEDCNVYSCGTGIKTVNVNNCLINDGNLDSNTVNISMTDSYAWTFQDTGLSNSTGDSMTLLRCGNSVYIDNGTNNCGGNGVTLTSCKDISFALSTFSFNGGDGLEFISGNSDIQISSNSIYSNQSDGITLAASTLRTIINNNTIRGNTSYGITVADATMVDTLIVGNIFSSNGTSAVTDSGTTTKIRSNIGVADN